MLGDNIKKYRKISSLSQEELAEKVNVTRQSVSLWETGKTQPSVDILIKLASVLGVATDELLSDNSDNAVINNEVSTEVTNKEISTDESVDDNIKKNKNGRKKKGWLVLVSAIVSLALYIAILFTSVSSEIEIIFVVLFFARALLASAVIIGLLLLLSGKGKLEEKKMQKATRISLSVVTAVFVLFTAIGFFTFRDTYTPEELLESDTEYVKEIFPFIDLNVEPRENYDIYASHFPGTDIFTVKSINKNSNGTYTAYSCNYYKSDSLILNLKLNASNNVYEYFNGADFEKEKINAGKYDVTVYSLKDRYIAKIDGFGKCFFLKLDNAEIDTKELAELAVEQYILLQTASQSDMFLY